MEDFEQYVCLKRLEGRKATKYQLYVDYIRLLVGDSRKNSFDQINKIKCAQDIETHETESTANNYSRERFWYLDGDFERSVAFLTKQERLTARLYFIVGLTIEEIGCTLELSKGRVWQLLDKSKEKIKSHIS
jgi:DNA-directed RNA polymerase specialized sigma subunit